MRDRTRLAAPSVLAATSLCALAGCGSSTDSPSADLPVLHWNVRDVETGETKRFTGNAETSFPEGDGIHIVLTANSPDKIRRIVAEGSGRWTCYGSGGSRSHRVSEDPSEIRHTIRQGKTSEFLYYDSDFSGWKCGSGFGNPTGSFVFTGEGESFALDLGTAKLTICNPRGC